jgi:hypothetical protein
VCCVLLCVVSYCLLCGVCCVMCAIVCCVLCDVCCVLLSAVCCVLCAIVGCMLCDVSHVYNWFHTIPLLSTKCLFFLLFFALLPPSSAAGSVPLLEVLSVSFLCCSGLSQHACRLSRYSVA